jgi:hypothetical protein
MGLRAATNKSFVTEHLAYDEKQKKTYKVQNEKK